MTPEHIKAELFDLLVQQDSHQQLIRQLEEKKQAKLRELQDLLKPLPTPTDKTAN